MNGLIKSTKLDGANVLFSLVIALAGVATSLYVLATAFTGGGGVA